MLISSKIFWPSVHLSDIHGHMIDIVGCGGWAHTSDQSHLLQRRRPAGLLLPWEEETDAAKADKIENARETNQAKKQHKEEAILFPTFYYLTGPKPIMASCQNVFWSTARSFLGKDADISTGWSPSFEVEAGRTLASLFYQAVHLRGGGGNYVPVYLPSATHSFLQCSSTQGCLFHRMQYIQNLLVHVCHPFGFFLTHLVPSPTNTSACA